MHFNFRYWASLLALIAILCCASTWSSADEDPDAARDALIIETLLRLDDVDVNSNERLLQVVQRQLNRVKGKPEYIELVKKLKPKGVSEELTRLAIEHSEETLGVEAAGLLLESGEMATISAVVGGKDDAKAIRAISALGRAGGDKAVEMLKPIVESRVALGRRSAAFRGIARNRKGEAWLLELVAGGKLRKDLEFTAANILLNSNTPGVRDQAARHLKLPDTADAKPLPSVAELSRRRGKVENGLALFRKKATCSKCHKVRGDGKEVGPDLSEIGTKLSREALYVSILDPSAGISHNYESYSAILDNGTTVTGLMVSETDDSVTLKTSEAIVKTLDRDEIDELTKLKVSLMPSGLQKLLTADELVDIVEYLTTLKKRS